MTTAQLVFLYAAEELNISKAAGRAFVSQQCASNHIKNLEERYGIALFNRKPSLTLTSAGECLYSYLRQFSVLEKNMDASIQEICQGASGQLRVGLNPTRARILMPPILARYSQEFPQVKVSLHFDDTVELMARLENGKIDLVIGVGMRTLSTSHFHIQPLAKVSVYFITTEQQILAHNPAIYSRLGESTLPIHELAAFPFSRNLEGSTLTELVDRCLYQEETTLDTRYSVSDYDMQISLCAKHIASAFCPSLVLKRVFEHNLYAPSAERIHIFSVEEITDGLQVDLIQNTAAFKPLYIERFIKLLSDTIDQVNREIEIYL